MEPTHRHNDRRAVAARGASGRQPKREPDALYDQLCAGTLVDGRYRVDETLGRGAMGVVVAATHVQLHERVALKFLDTRIRVTVDDFHARFRREAQVSAKLRGEHVARVIDVGLWQDRHPFMVMDHLTGTDLRKALNASGGVLPIDLATEYIVQICEGMAEAHALGIVHRDLKPSNILISKRPDGSDLIKILDFGISKWSPQEGQTDDITLTGVVLGSPKYMAPEQLFGASTVDARADVWSIGAILYELLTGRPPFAAPTLAQICRELALAKAPPAMHSDERTVPPAIEAVVLRCLQHELSARVANVAELAGSLLEAAGSPHAAAVRQRLEAVLATSRERAPLASTSGGVGNAGAPGVRELPGPSDAWAQADVWDDSQAGERSARPGPLAALIGLARRQRPWIAVGLFAAALLWAFVQFTTSRELTRTERPKLPPVQLHALPSIAPTVLPSGSPTPLRADAALAVPLPRAPHVGGDPDTTRKAAAPRKLSAGSPTAAQGPAKPRVLPGRVAPSLPSARRSEGGASARPASNPLEERL